VGWSELTSDGDFLRRFFRFFSGDDRYSLAAVCRAWRDALFSAPNLWQGLRPVLPCRTLRRWTDNEAEMKERKQVRGVGEIETRRGYLPSTKKGKNVTPSS